MFLIKLFPKFNVFTATPGANSRVGKFLNFFSVVRFSNEGCTGAGGLNGTCYTSAECRDRNGAATSSCAGQELTIRLRLLDIIISVIRRLRSLLYLWSVLWWNISRELHLPHYRDHFGAGKWRMRKTSNIDFIFVFSAFTRSAEQTRTWSSSDWILTSSTLPSPSPAGQALAPWPAPPLTVLW